MRRAITLLLAAALVAAMSGGVNAAQVKETKAFEDPAGDSGNVNQGAAIPGFDQAGLDLIGGSIATVKKNLRFTVEVASLSPDGRFIPEGVRLLWHFGVGTEQYQFTVKSFDVGKPDVVAGGVGQERIGQLYANGVARLEACREEATPAVNLVQCETTVYVEPTFDTETNTFSWEIPLSAVKAKKGTQILPGTSGHASTNCPVCFIPHYAERSLSPYSTIDAAALTGIHKV